jgi:hypothetical protein
MSFLNLELYFVQVLHSRLGEVLTCLIENIFSSSFFHKTEKIADVR